MIIFHADSRLGWVEPDTGEQGYLDLREPGQKGWRAGPMFPDGRYQALLSLEDLTISQLITGKVRTRNWIYDWVEHKMTGKLLEENRAADYLTVSSIFAQSGKLLIHALIEGEGHLLVGNPDGTDLRALTARGQGFHYGEAVSPDGSRLAVHVTASNAGNDGEWPWYCPGPYSINVMDIRSLERVLVAGQAGHLYFGPQWSPDGKWLAYLDCHSAEDPAHFRADLCVGASDGSGHRVVTEGQSHWFSTSYGTAEHRKGGSNTIVWSPDGRYLTYTRLLPGSVPDVEYDPSLPSHEDFIYRPEGARGGTQICLLDPFAGTAIELTAAEEGKWDLRPVFSPDGSRLAFVRAYLRQAPEIWTVRTDGREERLVAEGIAGIGADFPAWVKRPHRQP